MQQENHCCIIMTRKTATKKQADTCVPISSKYWSTDPQVLLLDSWCFLLCETVFFVVFFYTSGMRQLDDYWCDHGSYWWLYVKTRFSILSRQSIVHYYCFLYNNHT